MLPEEVLILEDMKAYISFCIAHGRPLNECLANISHDCYGIILKEDGFLPRTTGYAALLVEKKTGG